MNATYTLLFILVLAITTTAQGMAENPRELEFRTWFSMVVFSITAVLLVWWGRSRANRF